jgi:hypothetical protein
MPNSSLRALWAFALAVGSAALLPSVSHAQEDVVAKLRVLGPAETELDSGTHYVTGTERIKTSRRARCFIGGEGGSGDAVRLPGATAMGLLETAGDSNPDLDPLLVTDEFGFGLGLCGIGEAKADTSNFWNVTVNHQALQVGGDQVSLSSGDDVLWNLTEFPPPPELVLSAAPGTTNGSLPVNVVRWTCSTDFPPPDPVCTQAPAEGVTVTGGGSPVETNVNGAATVSLPVEGQYQLRAVNPGTDLPSARVDVCQSPTAGECPPEIAGHGWDIVGRKVADDFSATPYWDTVKAKGGDDRIRVHSGSDRVNCGGGLDKVILDPDGEDAVSDNCERVKNVSR